MISPMSFDRPEDLQYPVTAEIAVDRVQRMVRLPIRVSYPVATAIGGFTYGFRFKALVFLPIAMAGCWLYWSWLMPQWRRWAAGKGIDPALLQEVGEKRNLLWRKGSLLEKTEFR